MRFKKVLLVMPRYTETHYKTVDLPAGLGFISEALIQANIEHEVFDMTLGYSEQDLISRINEYKPDLIGFSMLTFGYLHNYDLIRKVKNNFKEIAIVLGGPHISTLQEKVFEECPEVDYGVTVEGEEIIVELCEGKLTPLDIKGLLYRENGRIVYTGNRPLISNIDKICFPKYSKFEVDKYRGGRPLSTSRGCPFQCIFCTIQMAIGARMRLRSAGLVVDEIEYWYNRGFKVFGVTDDNFSSSKDRVLQICREIKKRNLKDLNFICGNGLRADRVDREMLDEMREAGFKHISFGVESGSERILKRIKKGEKLERIESTIKDACEAGIMVTLFFLLGSPDETKEDLQKSVDLALKYPVYDARFYNIVPYPGTEIFRWLTEKNYFVRDAVDYLNCGSAWVNDPIYVTPELSLRDRKKLHFKLNRKVKTHTLKIKRKCHMGHVKEVLSRMGLPVWPSAIFARIYYTTFFQMHLLESRLVFALRGKLEKSSKL